MSTLGAGRGGPTSSALAHTKSVLSFPQLTPAPRNTSRPTRLRIKKQFPHTRTANARKTCDTRHTKKKGDSNTNKRESKKTGKKKMEKRQENWLQKMLMIYLIDLTMNICKDRSACEK